MKVLKMAAIAGAALALSGCEFIKSTKTATRYVAKMTCSCVYVTERSLAQCIADLPEAATQVEVTDNREAKLIEASVLVFNAKASYEEGRGCKLQD